MDLKYELGAYFPERFPRRRGDWTDCSHTVQKLLKLYILFFPACAWMDLKYELGSYFPERFPPPARGMDQLLTHVLDRIRVSRTRVLRLTLTRRPRGSRSTLRTGRVSESPSKSS